MSKPDFSIELSLSGIIAGVDEAGRGPWAGPVVAGAVILNHSEIDLRSSAAHAAHLNGASPRYARPENLGINDSKKLSPAKRDKLFDLIKDSYKSGVGIVSVEEIDSINILQASLLAMRRAVEQLGVIPDIALVDGNRAPPMPCKVQTVIGGDAKSLSIAAASIIAKVTRDRIMQQLAAEFPGYGWERNAGYGTSEHQMALAKLGVTPHHRRSFAPIRLLLEAA